jgi:CyaY protein
MTTIGLNEAEFNQAAGAALAHIEQALEDADLDFETPADGIIEVEFEDGSKIIINRHGVAREIWVAARSGVSFAAGRRLVRHQGGSRCMTSWALIAAQGGVMVRF